MAIKLKRETEMKNEKAKKIACLITTDASKRGVFSGLIYPEDMGKEVLNVEEMRMCVMWSADMKGVLGLASMGPNKSCRISKAVKRAIISGVTAVVELSDEAFKNWQKEPWG